MSVQPRNGTVTIPAETRRAFGLDKPGAQVEFVIRDGEIVLVPHVAVPTSEAWFWSRDTRREADADPAAGRYTDSDSADELPADLGWLAGKSEGEVDT